MRGFLENIVVKPVILPKIRNFGEDLSLFPVEKPVDKVENFFPGFLGNFS